MRVEPAATKETHTNKLNQTRAQANKIGFFAQIVSFSRVFFFFCVVVVVVFVYVLGDGRLSRAVCLINVCRLNSNSA